ncbi:MAG: transcription initiation factor IIB [Thermoplasmatota archaeon]
MENKTQTMKTNGKPERSETKGAAPGGDMGDGAVERCPECGSTSLLADTSRGETVCEKCGLVLREHEIDPRGSPAYGESERMQNGPPTGFVFRNQLTTEVGYPGRDGQGRSIRGAARRQAARLRGLQRRTRSTREHRRLATALTVLQRTSRTAGLPHSVEERAAFLYREARRADLIRGRSIEEIAAASVLLAARERSLPRSLGEIATASGVDRRTLARAFRVLQRSLSLRVAPSHARDFLPKIVSDLGLPEAVRQAASMLVERATREGLDNGLSGLGLAGGAVYVAARELGSRRTEKQVAKAAGVSDVTIRERIHELEAMAKAVSESENAPAAP